MKKMIGIVAVLSLLVGGGGAYFFLGGGESEPGADPNSASAEEVERDPIYLSLDPPFVANFEHLGTIRYLQLNLQIMSYEQAVIDKVQANIPAVRNSLIMLFGTQDYAVLTTTEGKEALREDARVTINEVVRLKDDALVDDVFFTGFVMQ